MESQKKIRVLVVDDSILFREVIARGISSEPMIEVVALAGDPFDARDKILKYNPDVITCDVEMPKMNGIEFLKIIRDQMRYKDLKVFIMTTSNEKSDQDKTHELGISGYIIKPMSYTDNSKNSDSMEAFVQFHLTKIFSET